MQVTTRKRIGGSSFGGLLSTRQGALALALACALAAAGILVFALSRYKQSVNNTAPKQATVLVATSLIPKGSSITTIASAQLYKPTAIVSTNMAAGAITNAQALQGKVAASDILPGQQLTATDFTAASGYDGQLLPNQRAISVTLDQAHGLGGVLQSGDHVDVYVGVSNGTGSTQSATQMQLLVPNATVLKTSGGAQPTTVLIVSSAQAPEVAYAADNGKLWLLLRPMNATNPATGTVTLNSILSTATANTKSSGTGTGVQP